MIENAPPITSTAWSSRTKRTVTLVCLVILGIILWQITDVLPLLVVSGVLSFLLNPLTTLLARRVTFFLPGSRIWAILLTFVIAGLFFLLLLLVIFPVLFSQFADFASNLPNVLKTLEADLQVWLSQPITFRGEPILLNGEPLIPLQQINQVLGSDEPFQLQNVDILGAGRTFVASLTGPTFSILGGAFRVLVNLLFVLTLMFYMLKDGSKFAQALVNITPESYRNDIRRLLYELAEVWNAYLRGQLILNVFIGVVTLIVTTILGVPNAPVLALMAGILEFVPNLGPLLALIPAALLALFSQSSTLPFLDGPTFALVVVVAYILIQNVESVLIVPRVMGGSLNLHPIVIMIGVLAGASIAGALGVILAAPIIASLRVLGQYLYGKLLDQPPFPEIPPRSGDAERVSLLQRVRAWLEARLNRPRSRGRVVK